VTRCLSLLRTAIYQKAGALLFPTLNAWALIRSPKAPRAVRRRCIHDRTNDKLYYESGRINGNRQPEFDFEIVSVNRVNECIELNGFSLNVTSRFAMQWRGLWIARFFSSRLVENLQARADRGLPAVAEASSPPKP
jgi:hypothetical protein